MKKLGSEKSGALPRSLPVRHRCKKRE
uniref:Uncharacterized protein n=1 Tax=Nelumbo nucifera TaxID=4432 RepID=A0A822YDL4_NELNU|nr:TPA_asm: hypothetical protein HUJ06_009293 [Nelumbo nucifera]